MLKNVLWRVVTILALVSFNGGVLFGAGVCVNTTGVGPHLNPATVSKNWANLEDICQENLFLVDGATLAGNPAYPANGWGVASTGIIFEGSTADTNEGLLVTANPTADRTWTLPNSSGTLALTSDIAAGLNPNGTSGGLVLAGGLLDSESITLKPNAIDTLIPSRAYITITGSNDPSTGRFMLINGFTGQVGDQANSNYMTWTGVAANRMTFSKAAQLTPLASPPVACSGAVEGTMYSDTSHALCFCDGTTWLKAIGAGTCA